MNALEVMLEVKRLDLGASEALTAAAIGKLGRCHAGEIAKLLGVSHQVVSGRLRALQVKSVVRKIEGRTIYDASTYTLTDKAKAFGKGEG